MSGALHCTPRTNTKRSLLRVGTSRPVLRGPVSRVALMLALLPLLLAEPLLFPLGPSTAPERDPLLLIWPLPVRVLVLHALVGIALLLVLLVVLLVLVLLLSVVVGPFPAGLLGRRSRAAETKRPCCRQPSTTNQLV